MKFSFSVKLLSRAFLIATLVIAGTNAPSRAGKYTESAHGNTTVGVNRSATATLGFKRGNCAHCHDQHASREAATHDPAAYALFTQNFDTSIAIDADDNYQEDNDICFTCHNDSGSIMQVGNKTYAETFGGFPTGSSSPVWAVNSILDAFNPVTGNSRTAHHLKDIYNYAKANFSYFKEGSNPCAACHNPHLAKRNKTDVDDPTLTAIAKPTDHDNLWGDDSGERMNQAVTPNTYQPPYYYNSTTTFEPGGIATHNGDKMPDYNTFCLDCHANEVAATNAGTVSANPSTTSGYLSAIDWSSSGDMHGGAARYAGNYATTATAILKNPYDTTLGGTTPNYVLSCLDCHEPHGTVLMNIYGTPNYYSYLLRKEINGVRVNCYTDVSTPCGWPQDAADWTMLDVCRRCHDVDMHCGGPRGCVACHYHGARNISAGCGAAWNQGAF